jgi:hypothetical protein
MKQGFSAILLSLFVLVTVVGQIPHSQVVFAYLGMSVDNPQLAKNLRDTDLQVLENRIKGYLLDIARQENYSIASPQNASSVLGLLQQKKAASFQEELLGYSTSLTANGVLVFRLEADLNNVLHLYAMMFSVPGGETVVNMVESANNLDQLLTKVPGLVYSLFGLNPPSAQNDRSVAGQSSRNAVGAFSRDHDLVIKDISGTWQGDYDQAKVEIRADGSGLIWFNQTDSMKIKVSVSGQTVYVRQDEPNSPKLYLSVFPYTIAVQVVRLARPMSWEFQVTPERNRMIGKKDTSYFYIEQSKILQVDNTYSRDAVWTRIP